MHEFELGKYLYQEGEKQYVISEFWQNLTKSYSAHIYLKDKAGLDIGKGVAELSFLGTKIIKPLHPHFFILIVFA